MVLRLAVGESVGWNLQMSQLDLLQSVLNMSAVKCCTGGIKISVVIPSREPAQYIRYVSGILLNRVEKQNVSGPIT